jgi:hypothetical protein
MRHNVMLTIASLLSILFFTFHLTDDIVRGFEKGGVSNLTAVPSLSFGCTERWCSPNGDRGISSSSSGRLLGWASSSST